MHVRTQVTSVSSRTIKAAASPRSQIGSICSFLTSKSYRPLHTTNMSDPPYALFVLNKSITNEVSNAGCIETLPGTKNYRISTPSLSAPAMVTATRAGTFGSRPTPTTTCRHVQKFTSHLQMLAELSLLFHPPSSPPGSARHPKTAQSGCRRCRALNPQPRRSMLWTRP